MANKSLSKDHQLNDDLDNRAINEMMHSQLDLFACDIQEWKIKGDVPSMDVPIFSLSKSDTSVRRYHQGNRSVTLTPSVIGAADMQDKKLILYVGSQIVARLNQGLPVSRRVKVDSYDYLVSTDKGDGGKAYDQIIGTLRRLRGQTIETNIETGGVRQTEAFGIIDGFKIIESTKKKGKKGSDIPVEAVHTFELVLSEWIYNSLINIDIATYDQEFFQLSKPIDMRLYEIARKHCNDQPLFKLNIDLLADKMAYKRERFKLRADIRNAIERNDLPSYKIALDTGPKIDQVVFYTRDSAKLSRHLVSKDLLTWFNGLEK